MLYSKIENKDVFLTQELLHKLSDRRSYAALLNDDSVRKALESIIVNYNIRDVDQIYDLFSNSNLSYLLELYYLDRYANSDKKKNAKYDALTLYYSDVSKYSLLSKEQEQELFIRYSKSTNPSEKAAIKDEIAKANLRLVISIAKRYLNRGMDLTELISEGNIGLLATIDRFDVNLGYRFSTYADFWIKQSIIRALENKTKVIRLPVHLYRNIMIVNDYLNNYYECNGVDMPLTQDNLNIIASDLGLSLYAVKSVINYKDVISLDQPYNNDENPLSDFIPSFNDNTEDIVLYNKQLEEIYDIIDKRLTDSEKLVLFYRYGFFDGDVKTLKEISSILGVTGEYVRQLEAKAIQKIRAELNMQDVKLKVIKNRQKTIVK